MKHLVIPMLLAAQAFTSMQVYAQQAKPVVPAQVLSQLPPPPPVLDPQLRKDLRASQKLDDDQRGAIVNKQKDLDGQLAPLSPEQIEHIQRNARNQERAINSSINGTPRKTQDRDIPWSVGLGSQDVHLGPGYVTTLLFFDSQGNAVPVSQTGAIVGDAEAIDVNSTGNAVVLYVKQPWRSTNMTVFLNNVPVPVQFSLTSDRGSTRPIDGQVRVRIVDANAANAIERGDMQNVNALLQLTNGAPGSSSMAVLPVLSVEKGDPSNRLNWTRVSNSMAQFRVGGDGMTYVLLKTGFKLIYPNVPNVISSLRGADGTEGYIVGGNNPRLFTVHDSNGALYRITVQR